ncbi:hypothetical protein [Gelidibacter japonicus]|nr:hypothetical protein [Gelidibacter japonicus]
MNDDLKRIIIISIVNGIAIYYINKMLDKSKVLPPKKENSIK